MNNFNFIYINKIMYLKEFIIFILITQSCKYFSNLIDVNIFTLEELDWVFINIYIIFYFLYLPLNIDLFLRYLVIIILTYIYIILINRYDGLQDLIATKNIFLIFDTFCIFDNPIEFNKLIDGIYCFSDKISLPVLSS